jgi:hypothetical protein
MPMGSLRLGILIAEGEGVAAIHSFYGAGGKAIKATAGLTGGLSVLNECLQYTHIRRYGSHYENHH